ncbi:MAG: Crp/Fnr family transcriptional regulator [Actinomycetes bacterium]
MPTLLADLPETVRREVLAAAVRRRFRKGDSVFHQGDPSNAVHLLVKGRVAVRWTTPLGDTVTLNVLGVGANFGELAATDEAATRSASVVALEPVETLALPTSTWAELRRTHPEVTEAVLGQLTSLVRDLSAQLVEALHLPAERRLVRRLVDLAALWEPDADGHVTITVTQEDLATMAGTTRPTANRVLQELVSAGEVALSRGRIVVLDPAAVRARAGRR